jgi:hypothetical protein
MKTVRGRIVVQDNSLRLTNSDKPKKGIAIFSWVHEGQMVGHTSLVLYVDVVQTRYGGEENDAM